MGLTTASSQSAASPGGFTSGVSLESATPGRADIAALSMVTHTKAVTLNFCTTSLLPSPAHLFSQRIEIGFDRPSRELPRFHLKFISPVTATHAFRHIPPACQVPTSPLA